MAKDTMKPRRTRILRFITAYTEKNGFCPSVREIGAAVGLKSTSTVYGHLQRMQRDGLLTVAPYKPRTIVPTGAAESKHITRRLKLESDDGSVGYVEAPDGFRIERYVDAQGPHTVVRCTDCTHEQTRCK